MDTLFKRAPFARGLIGSGILLTSAAAAAEPQVTVFGTRSSTAPSVENARAEAARVPGGVSVVDSSEYDDRRASTLQDMFSLTPGVFVQSRFGAEESRLSIRGSGLQRTFHLRGVELLQDGVPLTLADGGADFQAIEPMALAYTQVLRGANALEFGSTSLGGAINFVTPSGHDASSFRPRLEVGSAGYRRGLVTTGDVVGRMDYFLSASAYEQEGYRDWSRQRNTRVFGNAGFRLGDRVETRLFATLVHSDSQLPGSLTLAQFRANPAAANAGNLAGRQKRDFNLFRIADRTAIELDRGTLMLSASYSAKSLWHPIFQVLEQRSDDYNLSARYTNEAQIAGRANRLVLGLTPSWNTVGDDRFVNEGGQAGARTAQSRQRARNLTLYAEDEWSPSDQWTLIAGARWSYASRRYEDRFLLDGNQSFSTSFDQPALKLGVLWQPRPALSIFGNLSDSFEPPSFGELSGGVRATALRAQTARTVELGTRGEWRRLQWDIAAYSAEVRDELLSLNTADGQPLGTVNAPRTIHRGLEMGADITLAPSITWRSSYLWNDFRFDRDSVYGSGALPGIPRHAYRGEINWTLHAPYTLALTCEAASRYAIDMAHSLETDAYTVWGLRLMRDVKSGVAWFIDARNLTDRDYIATSGVIADARGLDTAQFLPGQGRAIFVGVDWRGH